MKNECIEETCSLVQCGLLSFNRLSLGWAKIQSPSVDEDSTGFSFVLSLNGCIVIFCY